MCLYLKLEIKSKQFSGYYFIFDYPFGPILQFGNNLNHHLHELESFSKSATHLFLYQALRGFGQKISKNYELPFMFASSCFRFCGQSAFCLSKFVFLIDIQPIPKQGQMWPHHVWYDLHMFGILPNHSLMCLVLTQI